MLKENTVIGLNAALALAIAAICAFSSSVNAQANNGVGKFDIEKVRRAVVEPGSAGTADSATAATAAPAAQKDNFGWLTLRIGFYLLLVIAVIYGATWGVKRLGLAGRSKIRGGSMDTLEVLSLGPNRAILLVRVMDKVYVLAQTPNRIDVLDKVEGDKAIELISSSKGVVSISQFKDVFNSFMGKMKKTG